jgi:hypothetical protein
MHDPYEAKKEEIEEDLAAIGADPNLSDEEMNRIARHGWYMWKMQELEDEMEERDYLYDDDMEAEEEVVYYR